MDNLITQQKVHRFNQSNQSINTRSLLLSEDRILIATRLKKVQLTNDQNNISTLTNQLNLQACNNNHAVFDTGETQDVGLPWLEFGGTEIRCCICCKEEGDEEEDEVAFPQPDLGQPSVPGAERGRELVALWCPAD